MGLFSIDESTCTLCGVCAEVCPVGNIIEWSTGSIPVPGKHARSLCITCGHCVSACPTGAFQLTAMPPESLEPVEPSAMPSYESLSRLMKSRRSIRCYRPEMVDSATVDELIQVSAYVPTGENSQSVGWLVASGRDTLGALSETTIEWMRYLDRENHPAAAQFGAKHLIAAWDCGTDLILRDAPHVVIAHGAKGNPIDTVNCTIALTWFELAAAARRLGACWAGYLNACAMYWAPMQERLGLPGGRVVCGAMMFGYPKHDYHRIPLRKKPVVTHL